MDSPPSLAQAVEPCTDLHPDTPHEHIEGIRPMWIRPAPPVFQEISDPLVTITSQSTAILTSLVIANNRCCHLKKSNEWSHSHTHQVSGSVSISTANSLGIQPGGFFDAVLFGAKLAAHSQVDIETSQQTSFSKSWTEQESHSSETTIKACTTTQYQRSKERFVAFCKIVVNRIETTCIPAEPGFEWLGNSKCQSYSAELASAEATGYEPILETWGPDAVIAGCPENCAAIGAIIGPCPTGTGN